MRKNAFTLVELLTVIAIMGVLAAILFPAFISTREQARKATCALNMRQLGMAMILYAQDNDDRLPDFHVDPMSTKAKNGATFEHEHFCRARHLKFNQPSFFSLLQPFLRNQSTNFCPSDTDRIQGARLVTSYEYKLWLAAGRTLSEVPYPTGLAAIWEQWGYHYGGKKAPEYDRATEMNILFLDGHVHLERLSDTSTAQAGRIPDLHVLYYGKGTTDPLYGLDFAP